MAVIAQQGLTDANFVTERGMCQKYIRQCIQKGYGSIFDKYHKADAKSSKRAWEGSEYAVDPEHGSLIGDIIYYTSSEHGPHGHVVIRIPNNRVAENSTVHHNGKNGGKGTRQLAELGRPSLIVRLPVR
jgi:hypothetical protein